MNFSTRPYHLKMRKSCSATLEDNIWLLLGDGNLPVRSQEQVVPVAFPGEDST